MISIVGRFLEHSRIYAFERDGEPRRVQRELMTGHAGRAAEAAATS